jgi:tripartite-type tricarboxylate transporter receptor subunit TctC
MDAIMRHVPYRGSTPMLIDLLSGQVHLAFDNLPASIEHIRSVWLADVGRRGAMKPAGRARGRNDMRRDQF